MEMIDTRPEYRRVAILAGDPARLTALAAALRQFAAADGRQVLLWAGVQRFRAPSSTHPPYRGLARVEARNITVDRVTEAEASLAVAASALAGQGWQVEAEVILDTGMEGIIERLAMSEVELLVTEPAAFGGQAEKIASRAGCALLLVPSTEPAVKAPTSTGGRLLRALHG
jgi:hypothetical protein